MTSLGDPTEGLTAEMARQFPVLLMDRTLPGVKTYLVIGPLDRVTQVGIEDPLLKGLEECPLDAPEPLLWAYHLGGVRETIQSRCEIKWCPGTLQLPDTLKIAARSWIAGYPKPLECLSAAQEIAKHKPSHEAVAALAQTIAEQHRWDLWSCVRPLAEGRGDITTLEWLEALVPS